MSRGDEIDELVSSVRNFVAHKEINRMVAPKPAEKLVLTADTRLSDEQVKAIDAEWAAELHALEKAGLVAPGKALELSVAELEEAIAKLPQDWDEEHAGRASADDADDSVEPAEPLSEASAPDTAAIEAMLVAKMHDSIDHDALRALVVKIVHEELSGELGERITRNVRKMVRREISRVMTSRELNGD
jgi:hypothetical protein